MSDRIEIFCPDCNKYQPLYQQSWTDYSGASRENEGYLFSDQVCTVCRRIVATLRMRAESSATEGAAAHA
jgi:hypothetical protein